ncbi:MAG: Gfo/Idh/MocA family oxidoreductase [Anaerovorax sp.]|nr:Gfo/Idh/MocA family oxidoreductase [Anaerovorax sp.]
MKKMRVGIIGIGFIGVAHIEALRRLGYVDVVAIATTSHAQEKADRLYVPKGYENYKEMIDNEKLDCVHICTPNSMHYEMAMYAMEKGVHIICEKPMTVTLQQAKELRDYAKEKGLIGAVNFTLRMYPQVVQMREMVKNGEVGSIFSVHGVYLQDWLFFDTDWSWRLEPELSGDTRAMSDIGSHWIDMVETIIGQKATEVFADFETFHKIRKKPLKEVETYSGMALRPEDYEEREINTEDYCSLLFHFDGGAKAAVTISQVYAGRKNQQIISISGSKCSLHWDSEDSNELWIGRRDSFNQKAAKDPSILSEETKKVISYPGGHVEGYPDTFKQNFHKVYTAIHEGKNVQGDFATFEDGYREMLINEKVFESAKTRQWVSVQE